MLAISKTPEAIVIGRPRNLAGLSGVTGFRGSVHVLKMNYNRCRFEVMVEAKPQGSLADAGRIELRKLFDGLLDWELSGGAVTEARCPAAENGGAPP